MKNTIRYAAALAGLFLLCALGFAAAKGDWVSRLAKQVLPRSATPGSAAVPCATPVSVLAVDFATHDGR